MCVLWPSRSEAVDGLRWAITHRARTGPASVLWTSCPRRKRSPVAAGRRRLSWPGNRWGLWEERTDGGARRWRGRATCLQRRIDQPQHPQAKRAAGSGERDPVLAAERQGGLRGTLRRSCCPPAAPSLSFVVSPSSYSLSLSQDVLSFPSICGTGASEQNAGHETSPQAP